MNEQQKSKSSVIVSIFSIHTKRLGFTRTIIGGGVMYFSIPLFVFLHFSVVVFMYSFLLAPAFGFKKLKSSNYIVLDRYKINNLHWFDKINCLFCGYSNGVIKLMNDQFIQFATNKTTPSFFKKTLLFIYVPIHLIFLIAGLFFSNFILNVIAKTLGLHRGSVRIISNKLYQHGFAVNYPSVQRKVIIFYMTIAKTIAFNLEQVESAWCPLKHLEKDEYVFPYHHKNFIERKELSSLSGVLIKEGTVSLNKPKKINKL